MKITIPKKGTKSRSLAKTISWRIIASLTTMVIVYIFTGHLYLAASVAIVEVVTKMVFYYFHERLWSRV